jgi:hypothetical protein
MRETTRQKQRGDTLIRLGRDILPGGGKSMISLHDVFPCKRSHLKECEAATRENASVSFLPGFPEDIYNTSTKATLGIR